MTYPNAKLGRIFRHKTLATDTAAGVGQTPMHPLVDTNLNLAAQQVRAALAQGVELDLAMTTTRNVTYPSAVLWDTVVSDPHAIYNAATGAITAPYDGVYLVSCSLALGVTAVGKYFELATLDINNYPATAIRSRDNCYAADGSMKVLNFPWVAHAGDVLRVQVPASSTLNIQGAGTSGALSRMSVTYTGGTPGPLTPPPYLPYAAGSLWLPGEPVNDVKLQRRFAELMDSLQPYLATVAPYSGRAIFLASSINQAIVSGAAVLWNSIDYDNTGTWQRAATGVLSIPADGLYAVGAALVDNTTGTDRQFTTDGKWSDLVKSNGAASHSGAALGFVKRYRKYDQVAVYPAASFTTENAYASFLAVTQLGW